MKLLATFFLLPLTCLCVHAYSQLGSSFFQSLQNGNTMDFLHHTKPNWNCGYVLMDDSISKTATAQSDVKHRKEPVLKVHGNIYYDYYYRSSIDTPYVLNDYQQHTIRTYLDATYKHNYPVRINFTARINNAGFLNNILGANMQFNSAQFAEIIRQKVMNWVSERQFDSKKLQDIKKQIDEKRNELQKLETLLDKPSKQQEEIEAREKAWLIKAKTSAGTDVTDSAISKITKNSSFQSADSNVEANSLAKRADSIYKRIDSIASAKRMRYDSAKQKYDSLSEQLIRLAKQYETLAGKVSSVSDNVLGKIKSARTNQQLSSVISEADVPDSLLPFGYKKLLAIKSFGIGRTVVDYSELSARNIAINGIQVEYNPRSYYAVAGGTIDYRYRDLILNGRNQQKQYLTMVRFGKGKIDGNNIIVSWYTGKKQLYNYVTSRNDSAIIPNHQIMGFTVEGHYKIGAHTFITGEVAKSSAPYYNRTIKGKNVLTSNLSFEDRSNEAYSIKVNSYVPKTDTRLAAVYKKIGANFQSFSLFNSGSEQSIWSARVDQFLFKRKLNLIASIRTNDFSSPYIDNGYYSNTVFKSIQATLRFKKLPVVSVGYFPTSQLTKLSDNQYIENLFYTLTGYLSQTFSLHNANMNTLLSYTRFYNRQADSGFVYFNTQNILLTHSFYSSRFSVSLNGAAAINNEYKLFTTGTDIQFALTKNFSLKGGQNIITRRSLITDRLVIIWVQQ